jgi:hypothetical protein
MRKQFDFQVWAPDQDFVEDYPQFRIQGAFQYFRDAIDFAVEVSRRALCDVALVTLGGFASPTSPPRVTIYNAGHLTGRELAYTGTARDDFGKCSVCEYNLPLVGSDPAGNRFCEVCSEEV